MAVNFKLMQIVKFKPGQTVFDVALEQYGNIEGVALIAEDNPSISLDEAEEGTEVLIRDEVIDKKTKNYFSNKTIVSI